MTKNVPYAFDTIPALLNAWPLASPRGAAAPRIHVLSDLHLDSGPYAIAPQVNFDILVAPGDLGPLEETIPWLAALNKPVVYVMGNHEHYGNVFTETVAKAKALAASTQIHILERESIILMGVRFLGATLWTSYGDWNVNLVREAYKRMNDYHEILAGNWRDVPGNEKWLQKHCKGIKLRVPERTADKPEKFHPAMAYREHLRTVQWLTRELAKEAPHVPTIVVSHHAPTYQALREAGTREEHLDIKNWDVHFRDGELIPVSAYASSLESLLARNAKTIALWAHGHVHHGLDYLVKGVRIVCNPRGRHLAGFTQADITHYALFGMHLTQEAIDNSQALAQAEPYRGDSSAFEPSLIISLQDGPCRPIRMAVQRHIFKLNELRKASAAYLPFVFKGHKVQKAAIGRAFEEDCRRFREVLDLIHGAVSYQLDESFSALGIRRLPSPMGEPYKPWDSGLSGPVTLNSYKKVIRNMDEWIVWAEQLHLAVHRYQERWAQTAYAALKHVTDKGIKVELARPPMAWLRTLCEERIILITNEDKATCTALKDELDNLVNPKIPRKWWVIVRGKDDEKPKKTNRLSAETVHAWLYK